PYGALSRTSGSVSAQYLSGPSYFRFGRGSRIRAGNQNGAWGNPCAIGKFSLVQEANSADRVYFFLCAGGHLVLTKWCAGLRQKALCRYTYSVVVSIRPSVLALTAQRGKLLKRQKLY